MAADAKATLTLDVEDSGLKRGLREAEQLIKHSALVSEKAVKHAKDYESQKTLDTVRKQKKAYKQYTKDIQDGYRKQISAAKGNIDKQVSLHKSMLKRMEQEEKKHSDRLKTLREQTAMGRARNRFDAAKAQSGDGLMGNLKGLKAAAGPAGMAIAGVGAAIAGAAKKLSDWGKEASNVEHALDRVASAGGYTAAEFEKVRAGLLSINRVGGETAQEIAQLAENMEAVRQPGENVAELTQRLVDMRAAARAAGEDISFEDLQKGVGTLGQAIGDTELAMDAITGFAGQLKGRVGGAFGEAVTELGTAQTKFQSFSTDSQQATEQAMTVFNAFAETTAFEASEITSSVEEIGLTLNDLATDAAKQGEVLGMFGDRFPELQERLKAGQADVGEFVDALMRMDNGAEIAASIGSTSGEGLAILMNSLRDSGRSMSEFKVSLEDLAGSAEIAGKAAVSPVQAAQAQVKTSLENIKLAVGSSVQGIVESQAEGLANAFQWVERQFKSQEQIAADAMSTARQSAEELAGFADRIGDFLTADTGQDPAAFIRDVADEIDYIGATAGPDAARSLELIATNSSLTDVEKMEQLKLALEGINNQLTGENFAAWREAYNENLEIMEDRTSTFGDKAKTFFSGLWGTLRGDMDAVRESAEAMASQDFGLQGAVDRARTYADGLKELADTATGDVREAYVARWLEALDTLNAAEARLGDERETRTQATLDAFDATMQMTDGQLSSQEAIEQVMARQLHLKEDEPELYDAILASLENHISAQEEQAELDELLLSLTSDTVLVHEDKLLAIEDENARKLAQLTLTKAQIDADIAHAKQLIEGLQAKVVAQDVANAMDQEAANLAERYRAALEGGEAAVIGRQEDSGARIAQLQEALASMETASAEVGKQIQELSKTAGPAARSGGRARGGGRRQSNRAADREAREAERERQRAERDKAKAEAERLRAAEEAHAEQVRIWQDQQQAARDATAEARRQAQEQQEALDALAKSIEAAVAKINEDWAAGVDAAGDSLEAVRQRYLDNYARHVEELDKQQETVQTLLSMFEHSSAELQGELAELTGQIQAQREEIRRHEMNIGILESYREYARSEEDVRNEARERARFLQAATGDEDNANAISEIAAAAVPITVQELLSRGQDLSRAVDLSTYLSGRNEFIDEEELTRQLDDANESLDAMNAQLSKLTASEETITGRLSTTNLDLVSAGAVEAGAEVATAVQNAAFIQDRMTELADALKAVKAAEDVDAAADAWAEFAAKRDAFLEQSAKIADSPQAAIDATREASARYADELAMMNAELDAMVTSGEAVQEDVDRLRALLERNFGREDETVTAVTAGLENNLKLLDENGEALLREVAVRENINEIIDITSAYSQAQIEENRGINEVLRLQTEERLAQVDAAHGLGLIDAATARALKSQLIEMRKSQEVSEDSADSAGAAFEIIKKIMDAMVEFGPVATDMVQTISGAVGQGADEMRKAIIDVVTDAGQVAADKIGAVTGLPIGEVYGMIESALMAIDTLIVNVMVHTDETLRAERERARVAQEIADAYAQQVAHAERMAGMADVFATMYPGAVDSVGERAGIAAGQMRNLVDELSTGLGVARSALEDPDLALAEFGKLQSGLSNNQRFLDRINAADVTKLWDGLGDKGFEDSGFGFFGMTEAEFNAMRDAYDPLTWMEDWFASRSGTLTAEVGRMEEMSGRFQELLGLMAGEDDLERESFVERMARRERQHEEAKLALQKELLSGNLTEEEHAAQLADLEINHLERKLKTEQGLYELAQEQFAEELITEEELWALKQQMLQTELDILRAKQDQNAEDSVANAAARELILRRQELLLKLRRGDINASERNELEGLGGRIIAELEKAGASPEALANAREALEKAVPGYAVGADYIPRDQLAMLHKGEAVLTAEQADAWRLLMRQDPFAGLRDIGAAWAEQRSSTSSTNTTNSNTFSPVVNINNPMIWDRSTITRLGQELRGTLRDIHDDFHRQQGTYQNR